MRPVHGPGDGKTLTFAKRGIEGETAIIDVGQQVRKIILDRGQPWCWPKGSISTAFVWYSVASAEGGWVSSVA
jgi:hypothetical protein